MAASAQPPVVKHQADQQHQEALRRHRPGAQLCPRSRPPARRPCAQIAHTRPTLLRRQEHRVPILAFGPRHQRVRCPVCDPADGQFLSCDPALGETCSDLRLGPAGPTNARHPAGLSTCGAPRWTARPPRSADVTPPRAERFRRYGDATSREGSECSVSGPAGGYDSGVIEAL